VRRKEDSLPLKSDFMKDTVQVEVEYGRRQWVWIQKHLGQASGRERCPRFLADILSVMACGRNADRGATSSGLAGREAVMP
jgi:hypothetical protein